MAWLLGNNGPPLRSSLARFFLPMALILSLTAAGIGYYFYRVTGSPFHMPQTVQREPYAVAPYFVWQSLRPEPVYRHKALHDFYADWEVKEVLPAIRSIPGLVWNALEKLISALLFFLGPVLIVPLAFLPQIVTRDRRLRGLIVIGAIVIAALALNAWFYAHYAICVSGGAGRGPACFWPGPYPLSVSSWWRYVW